MKINLKTILLVIFFINVVLLNAITKKDQDLYYNLINTVLLKDKRVGELNALGASLVHAAVQRAYEILGDKYMTIAARVDSKIAPFLKEKSKISGAFEHSIFDFHGKVSADEKRLAKTKLGDSQKRQLLDVEFEMLNEKYKPVVQAIKNLKGKTILPDEITFKSLEQLAQNNFYNLNNI